MGTLTGAITAIQALALALEGINSAPANPPESPGVFPFALSYAREGDLTFNPGGWGTSLHQVITELHWARQHLPLAVATALPFYETFIDALIADPTLGDAVEVVNTLHYEFGRMEYEGIQTIGWQFRIGFKVHEQET